MIEQGWVTAAQRVLAIDSYNSEALSVLGTVAAIRLSLQYDRVGTFASRSANRQVRFPKARQSSGMS